MVPGFGYEKFVGLIRLLTELLVSESEVVSINDGTHQYRKFVGRL